LRWATISSAFTCTARWRLVVSTYDFHYSEDWREKVERELVDETWRGWNDGVPVDADLVAHITVTLHRGICLHGKPIAEIFPVVPREHYLASVLADFDWGRERLAANPVYFLLNACRIFAYWRDGLICSKDEGGVWALPVLPEAFRGLVERALVVYRGESGDEHFEAATLAQFAAYVKERFTYGHP
jgi:streptomycin 3"-adenylyltransferase